MIQIGPVHLDNPFILAPMAGIGDPPFRRLCRRGGAGMVCAEMVSSNALYFNDEKSQAMLTIFPDEHPVSMQIFGSDPERLALAAQRAEQAGADIVDLNCGCPVPKITKTGAGASLTENESLFGKCLEAMAKAVKVPVTAKMRLGQKRGQSRAARLARIAEQAGVAAVTVHARAVEDRHDGPPDLDALREVVSAVKIPVLGNGGVESYQEARRMIREVGCAGVLIGQAAMGNPLLFLEMLEDARREGENFEQGPGSLPATRFDLLREHIRLNVEYYGEDVGIRSLRKVMGSYVKGLPCSAEFRGTAYTLRTEKDLNDLINRYESSLRAHVPFS